jgi:two-component system LytT family response regulator
MRVFIADDETDSRGIIKQYLKDEFRSAEIVGEASNGEETLRRLSELEVDLVFLDIELGDMSGLEVLEQLSEVNFEVIFVTAYDQYAIQAIKLDALDYVLKPIDRLEFVRAYHKAQNQLVERRKKTITPKRATSKDRMALPTSGGYRMIRLDQLIRCQADDNYTRFYLKGGQQILVSKTLKTYESHLTGKYPFVRIHAAHIVNINFISEYIRGRGGDVVLDTGEVLPVSDAKKKSVLEVLGLD